VTGEINSEVKEKLDAIIQVAKSAKPAEMVAFYQ
jgi:hypothetical protein